MPPQFAIGVFGVIFNEKEEILLCHRRDYDLWNLPGGTLEGGESVAECMLREIKEETGLDAEIVKLIGVYSKKEKNNIAFSFVCKVVGGEITLNDEADQIEYFSLDKFPSNMSPKQVERIKDALEYPDDVIFKIQTGKSSIELIKEGKL